MTLGRASSRLAIATAFLAVYVIWGATYLAIRFAVATMPPFLMASARWLVAGALLFAWRQAAGAPRPTAREWRSAAIVGALLIVGGNGIVSFAEQSVPSGLTALLIAMVPVWIAVFVAAASRARPSARVMGGLALGVAGVALIGGPAVLAGGSGWGIALVLAASVAWSAGSLYARRAPLPKDVLLGASMEMLCGGLVLALLSVATGEPSRFDVASVAPAAWWSLAFLVLFGSIVAYSCYVWLLQVVRPELVSTYAFVNPIVAVLLAALAADGRFTMLDLAAGALIVTAVAIVVTAPSLARRAPTADKAPPPDA